MNKINYHLRKNPLSSSDENLFMACVGKKDTQRQDAVIEHMMKRNTTISRQDIMIVLDLFKETVTDLVTDGFPVITDLFRARVSIRGGFTSFDDEFEKTRHTMRLNMTPTLKFRDDLDRTATVEKTDYKVSSQAISRLYDYGTRSFTAAFAPGALIGVHGKNLLPDEGDPVIMLKPEGSEEMIPMGTIMDVSDRMVMAHLPADLAAGAYTIYLIIEEGKKLIHVPFDEDITIT